MILRPYVIGVEELGGEAANPLYSKPCLYCTGGAAHDDGKRDDPIIAIWMRSVIKKPPLADEAD
jgi:hypothetical protein